jgi:heme O synthase-like polyprenyltransferase
VVVLPVYPATMLLEPFVKHLAVALKQSIDQAMDRAIDRAIDRTTDRAIQASNSH